MKRTILSLIFCLLASTFLAFSIHAESLDSYTSTESTASAAETRTLYYEDGPSKVYVGQLTEVDSETETQPAYFTRKYDLPFYLVYYKRYTLHSCTLPEIAFFWLHLDICFFNLSMVFGNHISEVLP